MKYAAPTCDVSKREEESMDAGRLDERFVVFNLD
jgi:hypothetical protein